MHSQLGDGPALRDDSPMDATVTAEDAFGYRSLGPATVPTVQRLADVAPTTLALMHGPAHSGDGAGWLHKLADSYATRIASLGSLATA